MADKLLEQVKNEIKNGTISSTFPVKGLVDLICSGEEGETSGIRDEWIQEVEEKENFVNDLTVLEEIPLKKPPDNINNILSFFEGDSHLGLFHSSVKKERTKKKVKREEDIVPPPPLPPHLPSRSSENNQSTSNVKTRKYAKKKKSKKTAKKRRKRFNPPRKKKHSPKVESQQNNRYEKSSNSTYYGNTNDRVPQPPPAPQSFPKRENPGFVSANEAGNLYPNSSGKTKGRHKNNNNNNNRSRRRYGGGGGGGGFDPVNNLVRSNAFGNVSSTNNSSQDYDDDDDDYDNNRRRRRRENSPPSPPLTGKKRKKFRVPRKRNEDDEPSRKKRKVRGKGKGKKGGKDDCLLSDNLITLFDSDEIPEELSHLELNMLNRIANEVIQRDFDVKFEDISGLDHCKQAVYEVVIFPLSCESDVFRGLRSPGHVLLYGPPGTGKTLIGKAVAGATKANFFSISASSLMSKWVGEGERLVRTMFELAHFLAPSVIFIDEIDSLLSRRGSEDSSSGLRRMKTEFLVQLDGANSSGKKKKKNNQQHVVVIGATNLPQEIDDAFVRRMSKRLYVPLPSPEARKKIFKNLILTGEVECDIQDHELDKAVEMTEGYSGADLKLIMKNSAYLPVKELSTKVGFAEFQQMKNPDIRPCIIDDVIAAIGATRPSVDPSTLEAYVEWNKKFGAQ